MSLGWLRMIARGDGFFAAIYYGLRHRDRTWTMDRVRDVFFRNAQIREQLYEAWSEHNFPKSNEGQEPISTPPMNGSENSENQNEEADGESGGIESLLDSLRNVQRQSQTLNPSTSAGSSTT
jgi:hypothetical protein